MKKYLWNLAATAALGCMMPGGVQAAHEERPNFVWFMTEDVAKHFLSIYNGGKYGAVTPHVDELARGGVVFTNAYSNAPVSSAARSTLITGCYAPRLGVQLHRKMEEVPLPEGLNMFPAYLRKAGYHTSNAAKTDYNWFLDKETWDIVAGKMGAWRERPDKDMPFFHVRTNTVTHESSLHFKKERVADRKPGTSADSVRVHPNHPDTELFRYTYATFYERIERSDRELGRLMDMLREDGELDNTFIFYFGDNGGAVPGSKGYTTETGLQVPLVVYIPEKWRDRIPLQTGTRVDGMVSFVDFGPTLLHLAGIEVPEQMDGTPFLGEDVSRKQLDKRDEVFCYGDRFDELYAFNRTLRKGNFKYSRNYLPYHPKSLYAAYRYKQAAFREWKHLYEAGKLNEVQGRFFEPQGTEELYDLSADPYETNNLAGDASYRKVLRKMRRLLKKHLIDQCDLGVYPECVWLRQGKEAPASFGLAHRQDIRRYLDIADWEMEDGRKAGLQEKIGRALDSQDPVERYWAATACASYGAGNRFARERLERLTRDEEAYVASRAVVALSLMRNEFPGTRMPDVLRRAEGIPETLQVLNDMAFLQEHFPGCRFALDSEWQEAESQEITWRMNYLSDGFPEK